MFPNTPSPGTQGPSKQQAAARDTIHLGMSPPKSFRKAHFLGPCLM